MVKFAKVIPVGSENENPLTMQFSLFYWTKPVDAGDMNRRWNHDERNQVCSTWIFLVIPHHTSDDSRFVYFKMKRSAQLKFSSFEDWRDTDPVFVSGSVSTICTSYACFCARLLWYWPDLNPVQAGQNITSGWNRHHDGAGYFHQYARRRSAVPTGLKRQKKVAQDFIDPALPIVLVWSFWGESFTQCPSDYRSFGFEKFIFRNPVRNAGWRYCNRWRIGHAVNRIRTSKAKSKVIILINWWRNNIEQIVPLQQVKLPKHLEYGSMLIGVELRDLHDIRCKVLLVFNTPIWKKIDEEVLKQIASETGGKYSSYQYEAIEWNLFRHRQTGKSKIDVLELDINQKNFIP